jgi:hypothetical protein
LPAGWVVGVFVAVAVVLVAVAARADLVARRSSASVVLAVVPLLAAGVLVTYVFGEDSYRDNGTTRWDAYRKPGGALGPMFVLSVALMVVFAALIGYAAGSGRERLLRMASIGAGVTVLMLLIPTAVGFSLN